MATLIFDIETVGDDWEGLDSATQDVLTAWIDRTITNEAERSVQLKSLKDRLGFSPLTGQIISIAVYDLERSLGSVYFVGEGPESVFEAGGFICKQRTEKELIEDFWETAQNYDTIVTFNGRAFDVPFLIHRSMVWEVKPSIDMMRRRYLSQQTMPYHIDLLDELTFYGAMSRRPSLHLFCNAYGIASPKEEMNGYKVAKFFHAKKFQEIARYNASDVIATTELYQKWKTYLAPRSWLNVVEY